MKLLPLLLLCALYIQTNFYSSQFISFANDHAFELAEDTLKRYITGDTANVATTTKPGLILAGGGGDVAPAMLWMLERSGGGDIGVIRSSGADV